MENYNPNIDLMYLKRIADDNLAGSEILWNSKNIFSSWHLLHESLEKILKVLWAKENLSQFKDQDDLNKKLRNFGHDILNIVESLNEETKKGINKLFETDGLLIYK